MLKYDNGTAVMWKRSPCLSEIHMRTFMNKIRCMEFAAANY